MIQFITIYNIYVGLHFNIRVNRLTACVAQLAKASDTQAVGRGFEPHPDHSNRS